MVVDGGAGKLCCDDEVGENMAVRSNPFVELCGLSLACTGLEVLGRLGGSKTKPSCGICSWLGGFIKLTDLSKIRGPPGGRNAARAGGRAVEAGGGAYGFVGDSKPAADAGGTTVRL